MNTLKNIRIFTDYYVLKGESKEAEIDLTDNGFLIIRSKEAGLAISLANYAHTYQLVLRMADRLFLKSTGLLYTGCSGDDLINHDVRGTFYYEILLIVLKCILL